MSNKENKDKNNPAAKKGFPGYPEYPGKEDIYRQEKEEEYKSREEQKREEEGIEDQSFDEVLDFPGAVLEDADEAIGEVDEEKNYYSRGGDNHDNLEEDDEDS
jgi:hypothetical protein